MLISVPKVEFSDQQSQLQNISNFLSHEKINYFKIISILPVNSTFKLLLILALAHSSETSAVIHSKWKCMQAKAHRKPEANIDLSGEERLQNIYQSGWNQQGCWNKVQNVFH